MDNIIFLIIAAIAGLVIGFIIAKVLERNKASEIVKGRKERLRTKHYKRC